MSKVEVEAAAMSRLIDKLVDRKLKNSGIIINNKKYTVSFKQEGIQIDTRTFLTEKINQIQSAFDLIMERGTDNSESNLKLLAISALFTNLAIPISIENLLKTRAVYPGIIFMMPQAMTQIILSITATVAVIGSIIEDDTEIVLTETDELSEDNYDLSVDSLMDTITESIYENACIGTSIEETLQFEEDAIESLNEEETKLLSKAISNIREIIYNDSSVFN